MIHRAKENIIIERGVLTVIAGAPNVGKSSLFNCLLGKERAIVTQQPGTTRDIIEMECLIEGILFRLVDTAGLRTGGGQAERLGMEYAKTYLEKADLILFVHEAGRNLSAVEKRFMNQCLGREFIRIANKIDLAPAACVMPQYFLPVSAKQGTGMDKLKKEMLHFVRIGGSGEKAGPEAINIRQKNLLESACELLDKMDLRLSPEYIAADLQEVTDRLAEITGRITGQDVLEKIFSSFCIGK